MPYGWSCIDGKICNGNFITWPYWNENSTTYIVLVFRYLPGSSAKAAAVLVCEWLKLVSNWACTATVEGVDMALAVIATN